MQALPTLFSLDNPKAVLAQGLGYLNAIHYMAPARTALASGTVCANSNAHCERHCLGVYSGQAAIVSDLEHGLNMVRRSRIRKTLLFIADARAYLGHIARAIRRVIRRAARLGFQVCIRLNGSSDIAWEKIKIGGLTIFEMFPGIQFVDYTKNPRRLGHGIPNYHLTLSYSGENWTDCATALCAGHNVAMIFGDTLPDRFQGFRVIDGTAHDLRHLDPRGVVVGLVAKGRKLRNAVTPFVVRGGVFA